MASAAAASLVSAQAGARVMIFGRIRAGRGSPLQALIGAPRFRVPIGLQQRLQRRLAGTTQIWAGLGTGELGRKEGDKEEQGKKEGERGEPGKEERERDEPGKEEGERGESYRGKVLVHLSEEDIEFHPDLLLEKILALLERLAGPGVLVRVGDRLALVEGEQVPAGEYNFRQKKSKPEPRFSKDPQLGEERLVKRLAIIIREGEERTKRELSEAMDEKLAKHRIRRNYSLRTVIGRTIR